MNPDSIFPSKLAAPDSDDPSYFFNREISWLAFNERVLEEALDARWPLLERLKFLAIHSSNLDEFFMIRVSGLHEQLEAHIAEKSADGLSPREQLTRIGLQVREQVAAAALALGNDILPTLREKGIEFLDWKSLDGETRRRARAFFRRSVFPVLTPLAVDPGHPFPFLSNLSISLAVEARDPETHERKFARVKVPETLSRFVSLEGLERRTAEPSREAPARFLLMEDLIAANLDDLFPGMEIVGCHPFRITRDMDMEIREDEAHDLLSIVDREIRRRKFGAVVRLEVPPGIPGRVRALLLENLEIDAEDVYESEGPLGLAAYSSIAALDRPELRDVPFSPAIPPALLEHSDVFRAISAGDILLHHPYDSFAPVLEFLNQAAEDPDVLAIKITLYRTGSNYQIIGALIRAVENGKQVAVSIELKARFDEANNIVWARALEHAGVHVFFGAADVKTHAKVALVVRREKDRLVRYVHLSTGNYNASTAKVYADVGLLTADPGIGEDASELFNSLSGFSKKSRYRKLAVAPVSLRESVLARIEAQSERSLRGEPSRIFAKLNSLVDAQVIRALYRASQAGVPIDLNIRGICCLRPGVPGLSESIRVFSVVGRFLEHDRVFIFGPAGQEEFFLSSADWMPRNFDRRVEVMFPVESAALREKLVSEIVDPVLADNCRARDLDSDGRYHRRQPGPREAERDCQAIVLEGSRRHGLRALPDSDRA
jgi:polyphosphate kinase